jgi:hypothetical protein
VRVSLRSLQACRTEFVARLQAPAGLPGWGWGVGRRSSRAGEPGVGHLLSEASFLTRVSSVSSELSKPASVSLCVCVCVSVCECAAATAPLEKNLQHLLPP